MKLNFLKKIRFNLWASFFIFALILLLVFALIQIIFFKPYYRETKYRAVHNLTHVISERLLSKTHLKEKDLSDTAINLLNNNVCTMIFNEKNKVIYQHDSIGEACFFKGSIEIDKIKYNIQRNPKDLIEMLKKEGVLKISYTYKQNYREMLLYGLKINQDYENYYMFINTPLEPFDNYVNFIFNQYFYTSIIALSIGFIFALILASRFSKPLIQMKKGASELAKGNYQKVVFKTSTYDEYQVLADALNNASFKLSKIEDLRKDLLANVSHDIKTPLTMIGAYAEMIKDLSGDDPVKRKEHLSVIIDEVNYLDKLVNDISQLSKMQAGFIELNKNNFDLKDKILQIIPIYEPLLKKKNITLKLDIKEVIIYADEVKISQVINNYLSNAVKYSYEDSEIMIKVIDFDQKVRVEVIDHGEGIKLEEQPYIWDRYYKIDKQFKRNLYQSGLGLAIAKAILQAHNAKFGLVSELNQGSTFYFEIFKNYEI